MKKRLLTLPVTSSFFLFGARGTGKSTLISKYYKKNSWYIDLLNANTEAIYLSEPQKLESQVLALPNSTKTIVIDEVQKLPKLLDVVHSLIEQTDKQFISY